MGERLHALGLPTTKAEPGARSILLLTVGGRSQAGPLPYASHRGHGPGKEPGPVIDTQEETAAPMAMLGPESAATSPDGRELLVVLNEAAGICLVKRAWPGGEGPRRDHREVHDRYAVAFHARRRPLGCTGRILAARV
jgi:hypothetical protein